MLTTVPSDTHPEMEKVQISLLRELSVARKIAIVCSLSETVIKLSRRAISRANPDLNDHEINCKFIALHYGSELADRFNEYMKTNFRDIF